MQSLLGDDPEESLFLQNPLFFYFANWVIYGSRDYFLTKQQKGGKAAEVLKLYILEQMDQFQLDLPKLAERFPSLNIAKAKMENDEASLSIFGDVLGSLGRFEVVPFRIETVECFGVDPDKTIFAIKNQFKVHYGVQVRLLIHALHCNR